MRSICKADRHFPARSVKTKVTCILINKQIGNPAKRLQFVIEPSEVNESNDYWGKVRLIRYPMSQLARNVSKCLLYWLLHKRTGTIGTPIKTSTDTTLVQSTEMYNFVPLLLYLVAQVTIALDIPRAHEKSPL